MVAVMPQEIGIMDVSFGRERQISAYMKLDSLETVEQAMLEMKMMRDTVNGKELRKKDIERMLKGMTQCL